MRTLGFLMGALLLVTSGASAVPNCSQINSSFCAPIPECPNKEIIWRGSCSNNPPDREWQCHWKNCTSGPSDLYSDWVPCSCPGQGGEGCDCLLAGTPITLADGTTKPVEAIQVGDRVLGYDEASKSMKAAVVVATHIPFETDHFYIINRKIRMTEAHPVLAGGKWVAVADLKVGDHLTDSRGLVQPILSIEEVDDVAPTYNFQVSGGTYVAGGIVVHNKENCEHFQQYPN
jgi:hypothetical protein